jgi:23S rRNA pseudouridine1911/1915/1917 synthase
LEELLPFILKKFDAIVGEKIHLYLFQHLDFSISHSQKYLSRSRVFDANNKVLKNNDIIETNHIYVAMFEGSTRGLKPMITTPKFAIFEKPSGVMVHPTGRNTPYCLLDEVKYHFGNDANLVHRIDQETSGLILIARNKVSEVDLKMLFESRHYDKKYLAIVNGKISKDIEISSPIKREGGFIKVKMCVCDDGKESFTTIRPLQYNSVLDQTLVEAIPHTGRQHQIRVHLDSIGHHIVGDPIYGVDESIADSYLNKTLCLEDRIKYTKEKRLMLHASYLGFSYEKIRYDFYSKNNIYIQ